MAKSLLEFHKATPAHETLRMAISTGNREMIRLIHGRLPGAERRNGSDLLDVAADFHREKARAWLLGDASALEKGGFAAGSLERRQADTLIQIQSEPPRPAATPSPLPRRLARTLRPNAPFSHKGSSSRPVHRQETTREGRPSKAPLSCPP
jgi:hypothetical protein